MAVSLYFVESKAKNITFCKKTNLNFFVHRLRNRGDISHQNQSLDFVQTVSLLTIKV